MLKEHHLQWAWQKYKMKIRLRFSWEYTVLDAFLGVEVLANES